MTTYKRAWELEGFPHAKITKRGWHQEEWISNCREVWIDQRGQPCEHYTQQFHVPVWTLWFPPKEKKKVTMYQPIYRSSEGGYWLSARWLSTKENFADPKLIVGWREIVVEVDA